MSADRPEAASGEGPEKLEELRPAVPEGAPGAERRGDSSAQRLLLGLLLLWALVGRLLFASVGLDGSRFFDERYSFENVQLILESGRLQSISSYYPMASYLPHTLVLATLDTVHRATGWTQLAVFEQTRSGEARFTPNARYVCRALQAVVGTLSLLLCYWVLRRVDGGWTALLGTLLVASTPNHLRLSVFFKPDILLLCGTLLVALLSLRLLDRLRLGLLLSSGAAIALTASSKPTGMSVAVCVVLATFLSRGGEAGDWSWRKRLLALGGAGLTSLALYLLINVDLRQQLEYLDRIRRQYDENATAGGPVSLLLQEAEILLSPAYHGIWIGLLGLSGLTVLFAVSLLRGLPPTRRVVVLLAFPASYSLLFALTTSYAKENQYLTVVPYTALGAAWLLVQGARLLRAAAPPRRASAVAGLSFGLLVGLALWQLTAATRFVYQSVVPSTGELMVDELRPRLRPVGLRFVLVEDDPRGAPFEVIRFRDRSAHRRVELDDVEPAQLDLSDVEIFPRRRLEESTYASRLQRSGVEVLEFSPRPFVARGPALVAVLHPWTPSREAVTVALEEEQGGTFGAELPPLVDGEVISFRLWLPRLDEAPSLQLDGRRLPLRSTRIDGRQDRYLGPRLRASPGARLRLPLPAGTVLEGDPVLEIHFWRR